MSPETRFLIEQAMKGFDQLSLQERRRLLKGIISVCPPESREAETATQILFHTDRLEHEQLNFREILFSK